MNTWQFIYNKLIASVDVMLLYVLESKGSSPGRQGFRMGVAADGDFQGTIGGGIMEHKFVEMARAMLKKNDEAGHLYKQVHDKNALTDQSGMICSGEQTIFLYRIKKSDKVQIDQLLQSLKQNRNGLLELTRAGIMFSDTIPGFDHHFEKNNASDFFYAEKTGYRNILHIIGGGHCALALSKLMKSMDFYTILYEERNGLNTMEQNLYVHEKHVVHSYNELSTLIAGGKNVFVVIMTFGYRSDDIALRALLKKQFKYIGMLGSRNKIEKMLKEYRSENIDESLLKQVHAPIGLQIKSQTTDEIAISIAAEIIAVKNKDQ